MSEGYFRIGKIVPHRSGGLWVEIKIKWHRNKTKAQAWGYVCMKGDELQAYKEAVEWCLGKRKRGEMQFDEGQLVQHDWRKPNKC